MKPTDLRCEQLPSPLGIETACPRFSWISSPTRKRKAKGSSPIGSDVLRERPNDERDAIWDSGKVMSSQMAQIAYAARLSNRRAATSGSFAPGTRSANPAKRPPSSRPAFGAAAWGAKWIARTTDISVEEAPMLRRTFTLSAKPKRARVYICGLGYYELSINGKKVGDHHLDPGPTRSIAARPT